ncbi:MAG: hypothetical protein AB1589_14125 [Cyanobacteriota bacterium]
MKQETTFSLSQSPVPKLKSDKLCLMGACLIIGVGGVIGGSVYG